MWVAIEINMFIRYMRIKRQTESERLDLEDHLFRGYKGTIRTT